MKTQIEKSKLRVYLKNLIDLEIVEREFSVSDGIKERANSNRGLYRLTDNFFRFRYSFVFTSYSELEAGDVDRVYEYTVKLHLHEYTSFIFEDVCLEYVRVLNRKGELSCRYAKIGRWRGKVTRLKRDPATGREKKHIYETDIDIMAVDPSEKQYLLGECRFKNSQFEIDDYRAFLSKWDEKKGSWRNAAFFPERFL